jgi:hypothetical protein
MDSSNVQKRFYVDLSEEKNVKTLKEFQNNQSFRLVFNVTGAKTEQQICWEKSKVDSASNPMMYTKRS